ncbi:MAG: flippase-like domain-containing protein, partial [Bifidobacteriaceae bacterium]|nr:flippase-like domain-containing protein [Bifidobacteriaceae bacterium]
MAKDVAKRRSKWVGTSTRSVWDGVEVVDAPAGRIRQSKDLVALAASALGLAIMLGASIFAPGTAAGVTEDIRSIASPVAAILQSIVSMLMSLATLVMPAAVIATALVRRQLLLAVQGVIAGVGGLILAYLAGWGIRVLDWEPLIQGMSIVVGGRFQVAIMPLVAVMSGVLTAMGPRSRRPVMGFSWNLLWAALAAWVLTGGATLPAAFVTVLIGRVAGLVSRYALGVTTDRATGAALVAGIRGAGLDPVRVVRVRDISDPENPTERLDVCDLRSGAYRPPVGASEAAVSDSTARALERQGGNRVYAVYSAEGKRWDAIVLDGDRQALGILQTTWRALRLRGMDHRSVVSLRQAAERAALLGYAAAAAGVRTPELIGVGEAADSMMLFQTHPPGLRSTVDMRTTEVTDAALVEVWRQLELAHQAGLAHRNITAESVLFSVSPGTEPQAWLIGWEYGDVASSELARSIDCAQMMAVLALKVGPERAVAAALEVLPRTALAALAALMQPIAFPGVTREQIRAHKSVIERTRQELADLVPAEEHAVPFQMVRVGWRTVLIAAMTLMAVWAVVTRFNFEQMVQAVSQANPWWMALSFVLSLFTYLGAAMTLVGFLPQRVSLWRAVLAQAAGSFGAISMPGGVAPIALSLRFLNRQGVRTSLAAATVALTQVALALVTVGLVVVVGIATGDAGVLSDLPTTAIIVVLLLVGLLGMLLLIPRLRNWIWAKLGPTLMQVWPRVVWVLGRPKRLIFALTGTLLQFGGYVAAFWAALVSFGLGHLPL